MLEPIAIANAVTISAFFSAYVAYISLWFAFNMVYVVKPEK